MIQQVSGRTLIAAGSAILGGILSGAYQHIRDYFERPQLKIDYEGTEGNKVVSKYKMGDTEIEEIFVRAKIANKGRRIAKNCKVYVNSIKEIVNTKEQNTLFLDARQLSWPRNDYTARDIPRGITCCVDIVGIRKDISEWRFKINNNLYASEEPMKSFRGTYRFELIATAENAKPFPHKIDVTYDGDWHQLRAASV
jgi:hypothetical protein